MAYNIFLVMRNEQAQSLIELMVSIVIITVALSGIVAIFPYIIEKNVRIQMQNEAINIANNELERLRAISYFDKDLDALGTIEGMVVIKQVGNYLVRLTVKYVDPKTRVAPERYPTEISEDTGLKEVTVSVKRKDNVGLQANLVTYFSKAKGGRG